MANFGRRAWLAGGVAAGLVARAHCGSAAPLPLAAVPISRLEIEWWRARHAAKLVEARRGQPNLVWLGDSITQQFESPLYQPTWQKFYAGRRSLNLGFSGDATSHLLWRIDNGEIDGIAPRATIILIGANNLGRLHWPAEDDSVGITAVVDRTRAKLPYTKILLLGILPSDRGPWVLRTSQQVNAALASRYGRGAVPGVTYMDVSALFMRDGAVLDSQFIDVRNTPPSPALHPSPEAQAQLAAAIEPTVTALMNP